MFESHLSVRQRPVDPSQMYRHSRTRTTSSNVFPNAAPQQHLPPHMQPREPQMSHAQRSASVNTFSTVSSGGGGSGNMAPPAAYRTSPTNDVRRSTSSRSGSASVAPQTSYVALLRRQKATVWSERAQFEDPRIAAQQKAARMRANREIHGAGGGGGGGYNGGVGGTRTSTGISSAGGKMSAKIRHHGSKAGALGFGADSNYVGIGGVPLRLSATEVEPEDSDEDDFGAGGSGMRLNHRRTGSSGRSSTASGRRNPPYRTSTGGLVTSGSGSGSGSGTRRYSPNDTPERADSLVDDGAFTTSAASGLRDDAASEKARSTASGSSAERADNVPDMASSNRLPANSTINQTLTRERSTRNPEDLRRRGSVDERTMTLSTAGRLFIANPD
ncbi:uncharacterized protein SPSK_07662 [Sporothrix schenckii 1099-18]|uniref:Uncharacterized protein n=2 Tax=Sporothrix schenckii TaxID=29908 RepID=U7Q0G2_SPOS1|nr:uncharacterized protein SPSK_07662 [Sporothrix schenckii 1099-18]ERT01353.1 hypothetical protein HMPREF1624_02598 [Sporothrix schenckii ATCC 58251]KJR88531.1 hypothetical protein SPSK_07662 [Sporothrix schenckii 1099-18]